MNYPLPDDSLHNGCVTCLSHDRVKKQKSSDSGKEENAYRINKMGVLN